MKYLHTLLFSIFCFTILPFELQAQSDLSIEVKKAGDALRRYMESAHPTPDIGREIPLTPMIPMITNSLTNPSFFDDVNMITAETDQLPVQNESSIAVNPKNPMNLIGSAVDYRASSSAWVYYSMDGGRTWKNINLGKPPKMTTSSNDPSVAFSRDGTGYLVYGAFGDRSKASPENGVFFARTTDGGVTWAKHIPVIQHLGEQTPDSTFEDKYYIWADNSPTSPYVDRLYIPWKRVIHSNRKCIFNRQRKYLVYARSRERSSSGNFRRYHIWSEFPIDSNWSRRRSLYSMEFWSKIQHRFR